MTIRLQRADSTLDLMTSDCSVIANTWDVNQVGVVGFNLFVRGDTPDDATARVEKLIRWVDDALLVASRGDESVELVVARGNTKPVYYDVTGGTVQPSPNESRYERGAVQILSVELTTTDYPRRDSYNIEATATLTNGGIQFVVPDVPGSCPALVQIDALDVSTAGVINRLMLFATGNADAISTGDLDPWVDAPAASGANNIADANAVGAEYASRSITSTVDYAAIARAAMPAGAMNRGRRHIFARAYDPAVAIGTPSALTASDTGYNPRIRSASLPLTVAGGGGQQISKSWTGSTLAGTTKFAVARRNLAGETASMPAPWGLLDSYSDPSPAAMSAFVFVNTDPAVRSGAETVTFSSAVQATGTLMIFEVENVSEEPLEVLVRSIDGTFPFANSGPEYDPSNTVPTLMIAAHVANTSISGGGTAAIYSAPSGGFTEYVDNNGMQLVAKVITSGAPVGTLGAVRTQSFATGATQFISWMIGLRVTPTAAGALDAGAYTVRVAAVDASGGISSATASTAATVTYDLGALSLSWTGPASGIVSYYRITLTAPDGKTYLFATPTNATTYTITTLVGAREVTALDSTAAATPTPNRLRAAVGINGGTLTPVGESVPLPALAGWYDVLLAADIELPPQRATIDGERPDWQIEVQAISASGIAASVRVDALWLPPADGSFCILEIPGLAHATKRRLLAETSRSGKSMTGWLRDATTGAIVDRLVTIGALTLRPGDNYIVGKADIAGGVSDVDSTKLTLALTVFPRDVWQSS